MDSGNNVHERKGRFEMTARLRLLSVCVFVTLTAWAPRDSAAQALVSFIGRPQDIGASGPYDGPVFNASAGPPANLQSGSFRSIVEIMWGQSPTFRHQCRRLAAETTLVVKLLVNTSDRHSSVRAWTEMSRNDGRLILVRVVILSPTNAVELIAHEIAHIIEQLDGIGPRDRSSTRTTHAVSVAYESDRAAEIGRRVAREVRESRGLSTPRVFGQ